MAYITPDGQVCIMRGISLDSDYNHTVLQTSRDGQTRMLTGPEFRKFTFNEQSYQRVGSNKIRVATLADNLYDCNYMAFRNSGFGDKWFYAFITKVEYINNNTSEITYQIDEMQTWYFDYEIPECFVEREHTITDGLGENLIPEGLETGELIPQEKWDFTYPDSIAQNGYQFMFVVWYVPNRDWIIGNHIGASGHVVWDTGPVEPGRSRGMIANGVYMGSIFEKYPMNVNTDADRDETEIAINNLIDTIVSISGNIVNIAQVPFNLWTDWELNTRKPATRTMTRYMRMRNWDSMHTRYYTPKNNKLFTSPYKKLVVSNNAGQYSVYEWEKFMNPNYFDFRITGVPVVMPELMCYPHNYRGITDDYESGLVLDDFPTPPWSEDTFSKWWAQNRESVIMSMIGTAIMAIGTAAAIVGTGGAAGVAAAGATGAAETATAFASGATSLPTLAAAGTVTAGAKRSILNQIGGIISQKNAPDQINGQLSVTSLRTAQNRIGFSFYDMGLEYSRAKTIDNYFTMFGYAIHQIKRPNVMGNYNNLRPHWNYIETKGCIVHPKSGSGLSASAEAKIASIYNSGITFWSNINEIGDYSLDNSPR